MEKERNGIQLRGANNTPGSRLAQFHSYHLTVVFSRTSLVGTKTHMGNHIGCFQKGDQVIRLALLVKGSVGWVHTF